MENILLVLNIVLAIILVLLVLMQKSEGGALGIGVSQESFMFRAESRTRFLDKILERSPATRMDVVHLTTTSFVATKRAAACLVNPTAPPLKATRFLYKAYTAIISHTIRMFAPTAQQSTGLQTPPCHALWLRALATCEKSN